MVLSNETTQTVNIFHNEVLFSRVPGLPNLSKIHLTFFKKGNCKRDLLSSSNQVYVEASDSKKHGCFLTFKDPCMHAMSNIENYKIIPLKTKFFLITYVLKFREQLLH